MSSLPGLDLESYVAWNYDLVVENIPEVNDSLAIAEMLGNIKPRVRMTQAEFADVLSPFEPYRESVENWLMDFDEEYQSWRDYSFYSPVPNEVFEQANESLKQRNVSRL
jgi:hypothetical protein